MINGKHKVIHELANKIYDNNSKYFLKGTEAEEHEMKEVRLLLSGHLTQLALVLES